MIRILNWLSLRRGFEDLSQRGNVFSFVMHLMFSSVSLALGFQIVALPFCWVLGLMPMPLIDAVKLSVAMSWLLGSFVATFTGVFVAREIRSLAIAKAKYEHLSRIDGLSGLLNRRAFSEALDQTDGNASLAIADLDWFKSINDAYGHSAGDFVIRAVADILCHFAHDPHVTARLGGEEFGLIIQGETIQQRFERIDMIRRSISDLRLHFDGRLISTSISIGVAEISPERRPEVVYAAADRALYRAKANGRNCIVHEMTHGPQPLKQSIQAVS
ncbi:diguanylate cyclase [Agrobacterium vitis]|uniref:diguanylate cyclase n=3 Tax=Agrobacterium vitis TaxID=373 RepID=A0A6L6VDD4_AGRVI|nr:diguanylate cyclase [Agrobacterium vitis]MVA56308.1 diguanylate cyclase [Agrobacterium vitis]